MKGGGLQNLHPFSFCKSRKRLLDKTWDHQQNCVYDKVLYCTKRITGRIYEAPGNVFIDVLQTGRSYRAKNQNTKLYI